MRFDWDSFAIQLGLGFDWNSDLVRDCDSEGVGILLELDWDSEWDWDSIVILIL